MKIIVPVKRVVDCNFNVRAKSERAGVDITNVKMSIHPFDEMAIEEAMRRNQSGVAASQETPRSATGKLIESLLDQKQPGQVILGQQSNDGDRNQAGQMIGALASLRAFEVDEVWRRRQLGCQPLSPPIGV